MGSRQILTILILTNTLLSFITPTHCSSSKSENVTVSLYYETLCPYCANFIVNYLVKIFQNGLISIVNLRMVPWGNAWINKSDGSFICQVTSPSPSTFFLSFYLFLIFYFTAIFFKIVGATNCNRYHFYVDLPLISQHVTSILSLHLENQ